MEGVFSPVSLDNISLLYLEPPESINNCSKNLVGPDCQWGFYGYYVDFMQIKAVNIFFITITTFLIVFGVFGNTLVLLTIWRHKSMHSATNYYIFSLAISDLLMSCFVTPLKVIEFTFPFDQSFFSEALCSFTHYVMPIVVFTSIWTLVSVSIDRYVVILYPLKARAFNTKSRVKRNLCIIWLSACIVTTPYFYPYETSKIYLESEYGVISRLMCIDQFGKRFLIIFSSALFLLLYCIPLIILTFTCFSIARRLLYETNEVKMLKRSIRREHEKRKKVAKMVLVVIVAFIISWTPFFVVSMISTLTGILTNGNYVFILCLIHTCGSINSMVNPFIYVCMSARFRRGMCNVLALFIYPCGGRRFIRSIERRISLSDSGRSSEQDVSLRRKSSAMSNISSDRRAWSSSLRSYANRESSLANTTVIRICDETSVCDENSNPISIHRQEQQSLM